MAADEEAVKDYLIFKGFKATYKAFELEAKGEKDRGYRVWSGYFIHVKSVILSLNWAII